VFYLSQQSVLGAGVSMNRYDCIIGVESGLFGLEPYRSDAAAWEAWNATPNEQEKQEARLDSRFEKLAATAGAKRV